MTMIYLLCIKLERPLIKLTGRLILDMDLLGHFAREVVFFLFIIFLILIGALFVPPCRKKTFWHFIGVGLGVLLWVTDTPVAHCAGSELTITQEQGVPHQPASSSGASEDSLRSTARTGPDLNVPVRSPSVEAPAGPQFGLEAAAQLLLLLQANFNTLQARVGVLGRRYGWANNPEVHRAAAYHIYQELEMHNDSDVETQIELNTRLHRDPRFLDKLIKDYMNRDNRETSFWFLCSGSVFLVEESLSI